MPREAWPIKRVGCTELSPDIERPGHSLACSLVSILKTYPDSRGRDPYLEPVASIISTGSPCKQVSWLLNMAANMMDDTNSLNKATRILALCTRALLCLCQKPVHCILDPKGQTQVDPVSALELALARNLQFLGSATDSIAALG